MEESREFLALRRAQEQAAAACAVSEEERILRRELADYYAQRLAQMPNAAQIPEESAPAPHF
ncbi:hypothetical protein SKP52_17785 [Sphingopyxis fribergensis]|uniref:Uncharacterized protein n=1 Tax=Sphingopyxis fribergensis TaxID=1515612 RepID=A0A0A7PR25_9SPHN|nr:hypothetical protein [Sphingopyxis fribergensis]AJA10427.1 hypothetical protein SKP52_17785 [Sphingopyxis fribergensis]